MTPATAIDSLFHAVADRRRRALFDRIARSDGLSVADLTRGSGVTQGAISQHLKVLKTAGLVVGEASGRNVFYRADAHGLDPLFDWLTTYEAFWRGRLADLRDLLEEMDE
jgi:DNA-binding transcriptional ArsR family regulator